jgi:hypothetical protein
LRTIFGYVPIGLGLGKVMQFDKVTVHVAILVAGFG